MQSLSHTSTHTHTSTKLADCIECVNNLGETADFVLNKMTKLLWQLFFSFCSLLFVYFGAIITTWKSNQNGKKSIHTCVRKKQQPQVKGTKCKYCQQQQKQQQLRGENEAKVNENCNNNNNEDAFNSVAAAMKTTTTTTRTTTTAARMGGYRRRLQLRRQRWRKAPTQPQYTHANCSILNKFFRFIYSLFILAHFCFVY